MEAATPLRHPKVRTLGDHLAIDGLVVDDEAAVRLAREREEAGEDPAATVVDAIEIGARVLDREQTGANADFVKAEFERASRELEGEFTERARKVADFFGDKVDEVFGPEDGQLAKELQKLFSDGSSASVQNRVRELVSDALAKSREDLMRQFSSADGTNPLADFKAGTVRVLKAAEERQHETQQSLLRQMAELEKQVQSLRQENEKLDELEAERDRGTAKGRTFEEQVAAALEGIADAQGDVAEAVGDLKGATGKAGDVVVSIDACNGPPRGRVVFEAKDRKLSAPKAREELDSGMRERDADFAVLVVPSEDEIPARMQPLREYNGDKLVVTLDPEDDATLALAVGYRLARARVLMARSSGEGVDAGAIREAAERALQTIEEVRKVKSQLTGAKTSIDNAYELVEKMTAQVRGQLGQIDALVVATGDEQASLDIE
jgi:hypothetical protein